jgi:hypothetical protein
LQLHAAVASEQRAREGAAQAAAHAAQAQGAAQAERQRAEWAEHRVDVAWQQVAEAAARAQAAVERAEEADLQLTAFPAVRTPASWAPPCMFQSAVHASAL